MSGSSPLENDSVMSRQQAASNVAVNESCIPRNLGNCN
jgi:hypothetical protein